MSPPFRPTRPCARFMSGARSERPAARVRKSHRRLRLDHHRARSQRRRGRRRSVVRPRSQRRRQDDADEVVDRLSALHARARSPRRYADHGIRPGGTPARRRDVLSARAAGVRRSIRARQSHADARQPQARALPPLFRPLSDPGTPPEPACRHALGRREKDAFLRPRPCRGSAGDPARRAERRRAVGKYPAHGSADRARKSRPAPR